MRTPTFLNSYDITLECGIRRQATSSRINNKYRQKCPTDLGSVKCILLGSTTHIVEDVPEHQAHDIIKYLPRVFL
jgi:hypothetical protein